MKIYNLHSNGEREVKDLKITSHKEFNIYGKKETNRYVEYEIIGKNKTWTDFMSVKDFKKLNPKVKVKGLN